MLRALGALPRAAKRAIAGSPIRRDGLELDLDVQLLVRLSEFDPRPPVERLTPLAAREDLSRRAAVVEAPRIEGVTASETTIAGAQSTLAARLYVPDGDTGALLVYYHGGGWVTGDLDTHDQPCRLLARASGARVLSVEYRLAPEHPFPAPVDDAFAAFRDAVASAERFGADPARIAVGGDSAGGHLAAVTCQLAAAAGGPAPAFQLLIYPAVDFSHAAPSRHTFAEGFFLTKENMDWYEDRFLAPGADRRDPRVSPLLAETLSGLAPAMVVTAGFDPLRDEGEAYAARLREAGVPVVARRHPGYVHGFIHALAVGRGPWEALAEMGGVLRFALAQPAARRETALAGGLDGG